MFNHLREDIRVVFDRDPAARTFFEVLTTYPGLHAILWHRMSHWLWSIGFKWLARLSSTLARWFTGNRDSSRREHRPARVHRPRHGRGGGRNR